jgi:hypothetical protein
MNVQAHRKTPFLPHSCCVLCAGEEKKSAPTENEKSRARIRPRTQHRDLRDSEGSGPGVPNRTRRAAARRRRPPPARARDTSVPHRRAPVFDRPDPRDALRDRGRRGANVRCVTVRARGCRRHAGFTWRAAARRAPAGGRTSGVDVSWSQSKAE